MIATKLLEWYANNKRTMPWRGELDPYKVWISEVVLQQTRVLQGTDYYLRFVHKFPTVFDLANASEEEVLKLWQGLGYYTRARNLHRGAKQIVHDFGGIFPQSRAELKQIHGIGDYTSAAIASIVYNEPVAAIDGNVKRIMARVGAIDYIVDSKPFMVAIVENLSLVFDYNRAGDSNQALMDLGSMVCTPKNAKCDECPISGVCIAFMNRSVERYPVPKASKPKRDRYFWYLVHIQNNSMAFYKRTGKDIWTGLFEFPLIETKSESELEFLSDLEHRFPNKQFSIKRIDRLSKPHILSHQRIFASFVLIDNGFDGGFKEQYYKTEEMPPVHVLVQNYLDRLDN
ncbi:MAG: A/G-specific adenine glycosylase [Salinivirgaceae bacterium]|nr:A/G-specific adenine glycosylase [Salinivirgaceae bacterium]